MSKSKGQIKIIDCATGEEIVREPNAQELAEMEIAKAEAQTLKAEAEAKEAARQAILERLGLTADEAKLILG